MLKTKARILTRNIIKALPYSFDDPYANEIYQIILKDLEITYLLGRTDQVNNVKFEHDNERHLKSILLDVE